ncbi:hypothetical protein [Nocardioides alcanivorans]|uniref:hypothetical protein n=1 Tax=Nocardioides alcanivorans TaxID=2897352 RepID=UPI001F1F4672|nr:hypothetical protein [Nocardioides alcanivorans]
MNTLLLLATETLAKKPPEAKDVVAGWTALWIFVGLILAVALLCWSFVRQVRKVNRAKESGVFGEDSRPGHGPDADGPTK